MGRCMKHNTDDIDAWYDCRDCLADLQRCCRQKNKSMSDDTFVEKWVEANTGTWCFTNNKTTTCKSLHPNGA